ncbi:mediator of RNA polymerase II transcription subunit 7-like [Watersipora subatra]|uniref:mediator of RNA polymerase II transcription subunit 7-like n=1 Tax=Watersipora subatra TaxID=2589382 RepID=UPI00355BBD44
MAAPGRPEEETSLSWPLPPFQYIDKYTDEAVSSGRAPKPPPVIVNEPYSMFGSPFFPNESIIRSLESQRVRRLYSQSYDHKRELKKINHSLLTNFLDLLDILVKAPDSEQRVEKIEDITLLFINMHHLINEYRQHQARETIKVMMTVQKKQRVDITERFKQQLEKVSKSLTQGQVPLIESKPSLSLLQQLTASSQLVDELSAEPKDSGRSVQVIDTLDKLMCDIADGIDS